MYQPQCSKEPAALARLRRYYSVGSVDDILHEAKRRPATWVYVYESNLRGFLLYLLGRMPRPAQAVIYDPLGNAYYALPAHKVLGRA